MPRRPAPPAPTTQAGILPGPATLALSCLTWATGTHRNSRRVSAPHNDLGPSTSAHGLSRVRHREWSPARFQARSLTPAMKKSMCGCELTADLSPGPTTACCACLQPHAPASRICWEPIHPGGGAVRWRSSAIARGKPLLPPVGPGRREATISAQHRGSPDSGAERCGWCPRALQMPVESLPPDVRAPFSTHKPLLRKPDR